MTLRAKWWAVGLAVCAAAAAWADGGFDRFQAQIGVDDGARGRAGEAIFRIELDGQEVFKSDVLLPGQPPVAVDVPLGAARELSLFVDDEGDGHGGDWGNWLDARLVNSQTGAVLFLTDLVPEERRTWIPSNRDRNIIKEKLSVNDRVYLRGWGCISGSHMAFSGWEEAAARAEAAVDELNAAAATAVGSLTLQCAEPLPPGLTLTLDGTPLDGAALAAGVALPPTARLVVTTDPTQSRHTQWWATAAATVTAEGARTPLVDLVQPTPRVVHQDIGTNRAVLIGEAPADPVGYWCGRPVPPGGPVTFTLRDLPLAFGRAQFAQAEGDGRLIIRARRAVTTEVPAPGSVTSAVLQVVVDGQPVAHVFTDNPNSWEQAVAMQSWPTRIEGVTRPGADGSVADRFVVDLGIEMPDHAPLWLRTLQPDYSRFDFGEPRRLLVAAAWEIPGAGLVRWAGLDAALTAREQAIAKLVELRPALAAAADAAAVHAVVDAVLALDPKQPEVRLEAAARLRELGDLEHERRQWGLLAEDSRADLALLQQARARIDAIWEQMDPDPIPYPDDDAPSRTLRALGRAWPGGGDFLNHIWTVELAAPQRWTARLEFPLPPVERFGLLVNSRGVEVTATLRTADGTAPLAQKTAIHPMLDVTAPVSGGTLVLEISQNPDLTGLILAHTVEVVAWPLRGEADQPTEDWELELHDDGSATVRRTSAAPVLAALPRTAVNLRVAGARGYTVQEPITEYLVTWDGRLGTQCLPLLAVPAPGQALTISYDWPDAAYNAPMSKYSWDRHDHTYLRTPQGILDTTAQSRWRITRTPPGWELATSTPAPQGDDANLFLLDPKGAFEAKWKAPDVQTAWFAYPHRTLRIYFPDNPNNRRWSRVMMHYLRRIYDLQVEASGHERPYSLYVAVTGASQLSGYGGATAGDDHSSETWVASNGRMSPAAWRHQQNITGVDAHELHWITLRCRLPAAPTWTDKGFSTWLEEFSWRRTNLADSEWWRRKHLANLGPALELIRSLGHNPIQLEGDAYNHAPAEWRDKMNSLGWYISDQMYEKYGKDFWARFWAEQRRLYEHVYPVLSDRARHILFVDELTRISGDPALKQRFEQEWLFDLTPDPADQPDRFLIITGQPRVTRDDRPEFAQPDLDTTMWAAASGPGGWDDTVPGLAGYCGVAWYRFTFDVPADFKTENLVLTLGEIEVVDETFVNGVRVGGTGQFPPEAQPAPGVQRVYEVPAEALRPGQRNVLAIRVFDPDRHGGYRQLPTLRARLTADE
jgi:hypothetical protein